MRITKSNAHNYVIQVAALVRCFRLVRPPQHAVADNAKERFYTAPKTNVVAQAVVWNSHNRPLTECVWEVKRGFSDPMVEVHKLFDIQEITIHKLRHF